MGRIDYVRLSVFMLVSVAALSVGRLAVSAQTTDVSGAWVFAIQGDGPPVTAQVTLKVAGGQLSGHVSSPLSGEQDFTGSADGGKFEFAFPGDAGQMEFKGVADGPNTLKGTWESAGTGALGTFAAKRKE